MSVLRETCPLHSDLLTADRFGLPIFRLKLLVEPRSPVETGPEYLTLINLINLIAKRLSSVSVCITSQGLCFSFNTVLD